MANKYYIIQTKDHDLTILDKFNREFMQDKEPLSATKIYPRKVALDLWRDTKRFGINPSDNHDYFSVAKEQTIWFREVSFGKGFDIDTFMASIASIPNKADVLKALTHVAKPNLNKAWQISTDYEDDIGEDIVWADTASEAKYNSDVMNMHAIPFVEVRATRVQALDNREFEMTGTIFGNQPLIIETMNMDWTWYINDWLGQDGVEYSNNRNAFADNAVSASLVIEALDEYDKKPIKYRPVTVEDLDRYFKIIV